MTTIRLLAIDPGSNCGYSVMDVQQPVPPGLKAVRDTAGIWDLQQKRFEGAGMRFLRLRKFILEVNPDFVAYEQVQFAHRSTAASAMYWGVVHNITELCEEQKVAYAAIDTTAVKRRATGKGGGKSTKKPQMCQAANAFFNIIPPLDDTDAASNKDHNIADALWLMQIVIEEFANAVKPRGQ